MPEERYVEGVGRRKRATARVRLVPGTGTMVVNDKPVEVYFPRQHDAFNATAPLRVTGNEQRYDVSVKVEGGGPSGQAGAVSHGLARALVARDETLRKALRQAGLLTRDPREKERKKYGLKRARKAPQYTKR
ncbi:MAG: 30S ribosomal protein S9 [Anaerolineae bacterium]|nr:30S ribosomal protein S9 [Anaerolineae bacterium]